VKILFITTCWIAILSIPLHGQFSYKSRSEDFTLVGHHQDTAQLKLPKFTYGGEIREYLQFYQHVNFGQIPSTFTEPNPSQLWHRWLLNASWKISNTFRIFGQTNSTFRLFNPNPIISQVDQNALSFQQLFLESKLSSNSIIRFGKMENYYGNDRLMANREGPNNRNTYFGGLFRNYFPKSTLDLFYLHPMIQKPEFLNDEVSEENISGFYLQNWKLSKHQFMDIYGMYLLSNSREYLFHKGLEQRLTLGFRFVKPSGNWQYLFENAYQTGKFNDLTIRSFMSIWDINYTANNKLYFAFSGTFVPGDKNPNDEYLGTFNTLFAKPPFGQTVALNITNMVNFSPYIKYQFHPKSFFIIRTSFVSRESTADGIFTPNMSQLRPILGKVIPSEQKKVTDMYVFELNFFPKKSIQTLIEFGYSKAGAYLKETGSGQDVSYFALRGGYRF
jgi:hypothetical protein